MPAAVPAREGLIAFLGIGQSVNSGKCSSVTEVVQDGLCTGCGTCSSVCPEDAIAMKLDRRTERVVPILDEPRCVNCGTCLRVCPGRIVDYEYTDIRGVYGQPERRGQSHPVRFYLSYSTNHMIRFHSSSGGLVTQILLHALDSGLIDGALVTRMSNENPLEASPFISRSRTSIISASGSKYCPVSANSCISDILKVEGQYAVVGLPCHLHGLDRAQGEIEELRQRIALRIGLFCSGTPSLRATDFAIRSAGISVADVLSISYRGNGWPGGMMLETRTGEQIFMRYPGYFKGIGDAFIPLRCKVCLDWCSSHADISCGDAWLNECILDDKIGTSIAISRTKAGDDILHELARHGLVVLKEVPEARAISSQPGLSRKRRGIGATMAVSRLVGYDFPLSGSMKFQDPRPIEMLQCYISYLLGEAPAKRGLRSAIGCYAAVVNGISGVRKRLTNRF